jgi:uncharacterized membrane protein YfcA
MLTGLDVVLVAAASVAAGFVNAIAGGGTLITFPVLTAVGVPAVAANVTNSVALCPGFLGATAAQWKDLAGQARRLWITVPVSALGGIAGGVLLLRTDEQLFRTLVPFLLLAASALLALQDRLRAWLIRQNVHHPTSEHADATVAVPLGVAAVYGGYFGAGLGVIMLALFGLLLDDSLTRLNALKAVISLTITVAAAAFFVFSAHVIWPVGLLMAVGALAGGVLGGRLAARIRANSLKWTVVAIGIVAAVVYWVR